MSTVFERELDYYVVSNTRFQYSSGLIFECKNYLQSAHGPVK